MDPNLLLSHAAVGLAALVLGLLLGRRRAPQVSAAPSDAGPDALPDTLHATDWRIAALEGDLAARNVEVARIRADADARVEAMRMRLIETERMADSLQQALVASAAAPRHASDSDAQVADPEIPDSQIPLPLPDALSATLGRMQARIEVLARSQRTAAMPRAREP